MKLLRNFPAQVDSGNMHIFWVKYVGMIGGTTILQGFALMMLLSPLSPWPKSENWPKLTWRPKICRILDFDENDTIESEKFKELNGDIFSIWFFVSNNL